jgi:hypothetical protein
MAMDWLLGEEIRIHEAQKEDNTLAKREEFLTKPARLFLSNRVCLTTSNGTNIENPYVTNLKEGLRMRISGGRIAITYAQKRDPTVLISFRDNWIAAMLVQPRRTVELRLVYVVPSDTEEAALRFYDCAPVQVTLKE